MYKNSLKQILKILTFLSIVIVFIVLLIMSSDDKKIKDIKNFVIKGTKIIYITNSIQYSEYPIKLFEKYDVEYLYINSSDLNRIEKSKIEKLINSKYLSNIIVIFKDGKIVDAIIDYNSENDLNEFLQKYEIIPLVIGDVNGILESASEVLDSDLAILYVPYKYIDGLESQDSILKKISNEYSTTYKMIPAYLLSVFQQEKLNSMLQISSVEDQIVMLIKKGKIFNNVRGLHNEGGYLREFIDSGFIADEDYHIDAIDLDSFNVLLDSNSKNVILIVKDNCKYCDEVLESLSTISSEYNIDIYYLNIKEFSSDLSESISNKLTELGYSDGFTTPMTILTESNKLIDYIIGPSNGEYFIEIFTENGIIK